MGERGGEERGAGGETERGGVQQAQYKWGDSSVRRGDRVTVARALEFRLWRLTGRFRRHRRRCNVSHTSAINDAVFCYHDKK